MSEFAVVSDLTKALMGRRLVLSDQQSQELQTDLWREFQDSKMLPFISDICLVYIKYLRLFSVW